MGDLSHNELLHKADNLAAELNLVNKGSQLGFTTLFRFESHTSSESLRSSDRLQLRDMREAEDIDRLLENHPSVKWAARQHPLIRTKRTFNDPKFQAQWHLVGVNFIYKYMSLS